MTERIFLIGCAVVLALLVAGALVIPARDSSGGMSPDLMTEISEARDTCNDLGGTFEQWAHGGPRWRCNFDQMEERA